MFLKQKNKIKNIKINLGILSSSTVIATISVFLLFILPIFAQENINNNENTNTNTENQDNQEDSAQIEEDEEIQDQVNEFNTEISEKREKISELNKQGNIYKQNIVQKQKETASLKREIGLLNSNVNLTNIDITIAETEIEKIKLETQRIQGKISEKKGEIEKRKDQLSEYIRLMYKISRKSFLEIAILNDSFSDFYNEIKYLNDLDNNLKKELNRFETLKYDLELQEEDLLAKDVILAKTKQELLTKKQELFEQINYQDLLLEQTENTEDQYQDLLEELKKEADQIQAEVSSLERRIREKLAKEKGEQYFGEFSGTFTWPVDSRTITCVFHCLGYIYEKWLGPHSAIDIATPQGSPIYAAGDGYIAIARKLDWQVDAKGRKRSAYNYINIIHNQELSTVYGHLSQITVVEGTFVTQGQVIGYSGGLPGTAGAGSFSTGAHLHFEVRKVNESGIPIPVDPMQYLL